MLIVGDKDVEAKLVSVRVRGKGDVGARQLKDLIADMNREIAARK
jgi:threonyl-tRNA synthetase